MPQLQLLHCLEAAAEGGELIAVDGFFAAERLRREHADDFALLTRHAVPFRYVEKGKVDIRCTAPLIELDADGEVRAVRYNNRSAAPFDLPEEIVRDYYRAYRRFGRLLHDADALVGFKLGRRRSLHRRQPARAARPARLRPRPPASAGRLFGQGRSAEQAAGPGGRMNAVVEEIEALFARHGGEFYGEGVTMLQHALQTAALAQAEGADDALVVAALLHDVGHFLQPTDDSYGYHKHDRSGGEWLARRFGPAVSEPVRLHVAAKRYLCATEAELFRPAVGRLRALPRQAGRADVGAGNRRVCRAAARRSRRSPAALG